MIFDNRDDSPSPFPLNRRALLAAGAFLASQAALAPAAMAAPGDASANALPADTFMKVSRLLIDHQLDPIIGARIAPALAASDPAIAPAIEQILSIAAEKKAKIVEDFFDALPEGKTKETALKIIYVWYSGVINDEKDAEVFAYEKALMYQPTRDVMTIPSYALGAPNSWNAASGAPLSDMPDF